MKKNTPNDFELINIQARALFTQSANHARRLLNYFILFLALNSFQIKNNITAIIGGLMMNRINIS